MGARVIEEVVGRLVDCAGDVREVDRLDLTADERARAHLRARSRGGRELLVSLPRGVELEDGDILELEDGVAVVVSAAEEDVLEARPETARDWGIAAYQLGNLHRPVRFGADVILTPYEVASEHALAELGVPARRLRRSFSGERVLAAGSHHHD